MPDSNPLDPFDQLRERLISQLDTLVPFLAVAHEEVFEVLSRDYGHWYSDERLATRPESYQDYCQQVAQSAFLFGYSYVEAFITDIIPEIYRLRRDLLPPDKSLRYGEVVLSAAL